MEQITEYDLPDLVIPLNEYNWVYSFGCCWWTLRKDAKWFCIFEFDLKNIENDMSLIFTSKKITSDELFIMHEFVKQKEKYIQEIEKILKENNIEW